MTGKSKPREYHINKILERNPSILETIELGEPSRRNGKTCIEAKCRICGHEWVPRTGDLKDGKGCPECGKKKNRSRSYKPRDYHINKILEKNPTILETIELGESFRYEGQTLIHAKCKICDHEWTPRTGHLKKGYGCPKCKVPSRRKSREDHIKDIDQEKLILGDLIRVTGKKIRIYAKCKICDHEWTPRIGSLKSGHGCPMCSGNGPSSGHLLVREALETLGFVRGKTFYEEHHFVDDPEIRAYPYDFYIPSYRCLVEYQGGQHYAYTEYYHGDEQGFEYQLYKDQKKKDWAQDNGYLLLCIPYTVDRLDLIVKGLIERLEL